MNRRNLIGILGGAAAAWPLATRAQQPKDRVQDLHGRILRMQAEGVAEKITQFLKEIERQVGWTTQLSWEQGNIEQRRFDALRLLRQVPAITEFSQVDSSGKEQLWVSRLAVDVVGSGTDYSQDAKFSETVAKQVYYGPFYLRRNSEPYMTFGLSGVKSGAGVSVVELNLTLMWDIVGQTKVGDQGVAYVVDAEGRVIAHPDFNVRQSLWNLSPLAHVREARTAAGLSAGGRIARDMNGREVLAAYARVAGPGWLVFVELPIREIDARLQ